MDFLDLARKRCSVRKFLTKKVEEEKLLKILEAGRVAPTGANKQPQHIIVIQKEEGLKKLNQTTRTYGAPLALLVCGDRDQAWIRPFDKKKIHEIDATIVTDHMMLQATDLGLGSVWICYFNPELIRKEFNLPENLVPVNILVIGYPEGELLSPDRHNETRKELSSLVFYEHY